VGVALRIPCVFLISQRADERLQYLRASFPPSQLGLFHSLSLSHRLSLSPLSLCIVSLPLFSRTLTLARNLSRYLSTLHRDQRLSHAPMWPRGEGEHLICRERWRAMVTTLHFVFAFSLMSDMSSFVDGRPLAATTGFCHARVPNVQRR